MNHGTMMFNCRIKGDLIGSNNTTKEKAVQIGDDRPTNPSYTSRSVYDDVLRYSYDRAI
jgi:hypothetical protein